MASDPSDERGASEEIATSTLAEIYAQQGLLGRALAIYRRMQVRAPEDPTLADRIERLERRIAASAAETRGESTEVGEPILEAIPNPGPPRERLPWDPPTVEAEEASPSSQPAAQTPAPRVEPLDPQAFAAWLEGR